jgi:hypothetical protein
MNHHQSRNVEAKGEKRKREYRRCSVCVVCADDDVVRKVQLPDKKHEIFGNSSAHIQHNNHLNLASTYISPPSQSIKIFDNAKH